MTLLIVFGILLAIISIQKKIYDINEYAIFNKNINYKYLTKKINKFLENKTPKHFDNEPKVTIVTVVRNIISQGRKEMLIRNFESVHRQDYKNIEHLIIDGASNDGTVELLEEYKQKGWIRYISEPDDGIYDAMNKGIDLATGKYINFLNSDDYFIDDYAILASISAMEENKADFSFAANLTEKKFFKNTINTINEKAVISGLLLNHQTLFTTKESLVNLGKFNKKIIVSADLDFILKLFINGYIFVNISPRTVVSYNGNGFSFKNQKICREEMINFFKRAYENTTSLTQEQIHELAVCHKLDGDVLSKLVDFYGDKNPLLVNKIKDIFNYRPLYGYGLFGLIPIITNYVKGVSSNYKIQTRLFNFLPIMGRYSNNECKDFDIININKIKLFDIIPIISSKNVIIADYDSEIRPQHREVKLFNKILLYTSYESFTFEKNGLTYIKETKLFDLFPFKQTKVVCLDETNKCKETIKYY